jgi:hypothetical protein
VLAFLGAMIFLAMFMLKIIYIGQLTTILQVEGVKEHASGNEHGDISFN